MSNKNLFLIFFIILLDSFNAKILSQSLQRQWLNTCNNSKCTTAITQCSMTGCVDSTSCKNCIINKDPLCLQCAFDIFNPNNLFEIYGNDYLLCDPNIALETHVCSIFCKDEFKKNIGQCKQFEIYTACFCYSNFNGNLVKTENVVSEVRSVTNGNNEIAVGLENGDIYIYSNTGLFLRKFTTEPDHPVTGIAYLSNGNIAATGFFGTNIYSSNGTLKFTFAECCGQAITVLENGDIASTYGNDIYIWDHNSNIEKFHLYGHSDKVQSLAVLSNDVLASGSSDRIIRLWNTKYGVWLNSLIGHTSDVFSLIVLENGYLASGSADKTIKIWNVNTGVMVKNILTNHQNILFSIVLLPNGRIASGSADNSIKIWNKETGKLEKTLTNGHTFWVSQMVINNDGYLVSVSYDETIKFWN
ncbi:unnamed protein product [Brachionus calyciflorus]|uniref:Uncharacterized protein n=1 Tax=Brachionus calyciflorus TaxID=104777 RepID=A0A814B348_9BILA|nr:unnamed protein product [Brachionus calyciflorus]